MLTLDDLDYLTSAAGQSLLSGLAESAITEKSLLPLLDRLRRTHTPEQARAAVSLAAVRQKAVAKFGAGAAHMFFTDAALQQASDPQVRAYRAERIGVTDAVDVCCGIGADALALAGQGSTVLGLDVDPVRVAMARLNASAQGHESVRFQAADVRQRAIEAPFAFFDPARRDAQGRRLHDVEHYIPPLNLIKDWRVDHYAVKLSPGVDLGQLTDYVGGVEFVSVAGELKEAVLWSDAPRLYPRAVMITSDGVRYFWQREATPGDQTLSMPRGWLLEPDPALIRAGLVQDAAITFDACQLDTSIAYLTADHQPETPWLRGWQVLDWMPFHLKKLRAYLRERHIGKVTVKKRGSPLTPETLTAKLKLKGDGHCTLVLTRCNDQPIVLICADYAV